MFDMAQVIGITVICYIVGMIWKNIDQVDNKWIPVVVGVTGGILGVVGMYTMPDFPVHTIIDSIAVGIVSGLASTGADQVVKQFKKEKDETEDPEQ